MEQASPSRCALVTPGTRAAIEALAVDSIAPTFDFSELDTCHASARRSVLATRLRGAPADGAGSLDRVKWMETEESPATAPAGDQRQVRYAITVAFDLENGASERFNQLVAANAKASVAHEPGCLRFDVLNPVGPAPPHVLLYEIYADRAAFEAHLATSHFQAFDAATRDIVRHKTITEFSVSENAKPGSGDGPG